MSNLFWDVAGFGREEVCVFICAYLVKKKYQSNKCKQFLKSDDSIMFDEEEGSSALASCHPQFPLPQSIRFQVLKLSSTIYCISTQSGSSSDV